MENIENASSEEQIEKYHVSNSLTSSLSTDTESSSDYQHKKSFDDDEDDFFNNSANSSFIKDVPSTSTRIIASASSPLNFLADVNRTPFPSLSALMR